MMTGNISMALESIRTAKMRSFLTMLGIIVGILSVVTIVSIGEGVKQEVIGQINRLGPDLLTVRPGAIVTHSGDSTDVNLMAAVGGGTLNENDVNTISKTTGVGTVVPLSTVTGAITANGHNYTDEFVLGTNEGLPKVLNQKVQFGAFFGADDANRNAAIIGNRVAADLFQENAPIGQAFQIHGQTFIVRGVFDQFDTSPLNFGADYNHAIFIPFKIAKSLNNDQSDIQQILVKPRVADASQTAARAVDAALLQAHGGQRDYTVLRQSDNLAIADKVVHVLTGLISGIAAISLIVGGIGIMNIMLVAVSERTHEIGIRKAIGATSRQIMSQFLVEAAILSSIGGIIGLLLSLVADYCLRVFTTLQPAITWQIVVIALVVSVGVGMFFGVAPAVKAAHKDPIDALRE